MWLERLKRGLEKTRRKIADAIEGAVKRGIDEALFEQIEEILLLGDVGVEATSATIEGLKEKVRERKVNDSTELIELLKEELKKRLLGAESPLKLNEDGPTVYLIMGVNGSGKTTTIAKLAQKFKVKGKDKIIFAACDTFRAAAMEQLEVWANKVGAELIKHRSGADPGAVAYDAVDHALNKNMDIVLIDTAGRLQTKHNLMEELKKINRVVEKRLGGEMDERLLVLDATTGQNSISQAQKFNEAVPVTGIVLTKLDSTSKGGAIIPIYEKLSIPIKLIGVGESEEDLHEFSAKEFIEALF